MVKISIDARAQLGDLTLWRHAVGHGGINAHPLPEHVVQGMAKLQPRWIRIFIQEFFAVYPAPGRYDWRKLDPYMDALARTGAKVVAAITLKPPVLFPQIDHAVWQPVDMGAWQELIRQLVRRYSVEKEIVTHWEISNEPDIGEAGGSPYLMADPQAYHAYYTATLKPILEVFPRAKVGGPASAGMLGEPLPGFIHLCRQHGTRLDFLSWHLYHNDPGRHAYQVAVAKLLCAGMPKPPELFVTEWSKFPAAWNRGESARSSEETAEAPRRAAMVAATVIAMHGAGLDGSFYYHLWDQVCYPEDFAPFFSPLGVANMVHHWNEAPHRLALFGVNGEVRPQYFVYWMLARMGDTAVKVDSEDADVRVLGGQSAGKLSLLCVNHSLEAPCDRWLDLHFSNLEPGVRRLTVYRIDKARRWDNAALDLLPVEQRETDVLRDYMCQVWLPADSVALVELCQDA